jgi:hypothetical protein
MSEKPMNIGEALQAMAILGPRMPDVSKGTALSFVRTLLDSMARETPADALRLLALMRHEALEATALAMRDSGTHGFLMALFEGLRVNRVVDLMQAATVLGLSGKGWTDGR